MAEKSIAQMHANLCIRIRAENDEEILGRLRRLCEDERARTAISAFLNLKPGDIYYEISSDTTFQLTE